MRILSGRTEYVMSPELHMPVPLQPPVNGQVDDETGMKPEMLPTISPEDLYHPPMEFCYAKRFSRLFQLTKS